MEADDGALEQLVDEALTELRRMLPGYSVPELPRLTALVLELSDIRLAIAAEAMARRRHPAAAHSTQLWMGEEFHALIPGSRLVVWDGAGHCPMLEAPERFDDLVTSFVAETGGPST